MTHFKQIKNRLLGFIGELPPVRAAANLALNAGPAIFAFHRVLPRGTDCFEPELCTREDVFSNFLDWLEENYRVVSLDEVAAQPGKPAYRKRPQCAITFDDGWLDNFTHAFPELQRRGLPATIFLPSSYIGTDRKFWQELLWHYTKELKNRTDARAVMEEAASRLPWFPPSDGNLGSYGSLKRFLLTRQSAEAEEFTNLVGEIAGLAEIFPKRAFINWNEVKQMQAGGVRFGSHTQNHVLLTNTPPRLAKREIEQSREELKAKTGENVAGFAYPWGAVGLNSLPQVVEAGYRFAVTIEAGWAGRSCNRFLLPRIAVSDSVLDGGNNAFASGKARLSFTKNMLAGTNQRLLVGPKPNKRVKILFVLDLITEWEGGTERQLRLLIESLDQKYFEPKLCFLFDAPELAEVGLPCPLRVVCPRSERVPSALVRLWKLIAVFRQERPDIVQCFFIEGLIMGILAGRIANVPQVVGCIRNAGYWRKPVHRFIMKVITPLADRWQTNSRYLWRFQKDIEGVSENLIEIFPNGLDLSGLHPATPAERERLREELGLHAEGPICVSVANLARVKDLDTLITTAKLLKDLLPSFQFVIVGDGPLRDELERLATRLKVVEHVKFVGRQANVRPFLAAADLGVLTSVTEGSSNAVLEYLAMGLPVVVSDLPANRELVHGAFFRPGDAADFAAKICSLWNDLNRGPYKITQNRTKLAAFSLDNMTMRAESYYSRLVLMGRNA